MILTLDMKARGKGRPRFARGRVFTDDKTKAQEDAIALAWKALRAPVLSGPVRMIVQAEYAPPKRWTKRRRSEAIGQWKTTVPDGDNIWKLVADALNGVAYEDDAQIVDSGFSKTWGAQDRLTIEVGAA